MVLDGTGKAAGREEGSRRHIAAACTAKRVAHSRRVGRREGESMPIAMVEARSQYEPAAEVREQGELGRGDEDGRERRRDEVCIAAEKTWLLWCERRIVGRCVRRGGSRGKSRRWVKGN